MNTPYSGRVGAKFLAQAIVTNPLDLGLKLENIWEFVAYGPNGKLKWRDGFRNLIVNEGLNDLLGKYLKGSAYTAAFFVGLVNNVGFSAFAATDVAAQIGGTNGWAELVGYSQATRPALTLGAVASQSVDNSGSLATFTINTSVVIKGGFVVTNSTKSGTSGLIYGEGAFSGGNRTLGSGDTLTVQVTLTAATA